MEQQTNNKIRLSVIACSYLTPYLPDPMSDMQFAFARKIMDNMLKNKKGL